MMDMFHDRDDENGGRGSKSACDMDESQQRLLLERMPLWRSEGFSFRMGCWKYGGLDTPMVTQEQDMIPGAQATALRL